MVEVVSEGSPAGARFVPSDDALDDCWVEDVRSAEPDTLGTSDGEGLAGALSNDPSFPLGSGGEDVGHELAGGGGQVDAEVEGDDIPAARLGSGHEPGEIDQRS